MLPSVPDSDLNHVAIVKIARCQVNGSVASDPALGSCERDGLTVARSGSATACAALHGCSLSHKSIAFTLQQFAHVLSQQQAEEVERLATRPLGET